MEKVLIKMVEAEEKRGRAKWGAVDKDPISLLIAALEELGEVAHAINHIEGSEKITQEVAETIGILSRLFIMVNQRIIK